jgi:hypothetical protein
MISVLILFCQYLAPSLPPQPGILAPQSPIFNLESEMSLGDSLLKHGFNTEAVQEFRRSLWLADSVDTSAARTHLKLGLGLAAENQVFAGAEELREAGRIAPDLAEPAQTALAGYYAQRKRYDLAAFELSDLLVFTRDSVRRVSLNSAIGWLHLQEGDVASAASSFDLADKPGIAQALRSAKVTPSRSPTLAAVLSSFVPGSGEAYAGRTGTGLLAFAVTAGSLAWAVVAAKSDDWVSTSVIVSTLFWRFYNGSRTNAVAFADDYNSASRRRRIARLAAELPRPDWFSGTDSVLGYRVRPDTSAIDSMASLK